MFLRPLSRLLFLTAFALAIPLVLAKTAHAIQFPLEIIEHFDGRTIVISVNQSDIDKTPTWNPTAGSPPLTIAELIKDIQQWTAQDKDLATATIAKIELKQILHHQNTDRWYYLVQLRTIDEDKPGMYFLAVLMNGKILPAIREPAAFK